MSSLLTSQIIEACAGDPRHDPALSLESLARIDRRCEEFEQALRVGRPAVIEECLNACSDVSRTALLRELLAVELEHRAPGGKRPSRAEYLARFPEFEAVVDLVFAEARSPDDALAIPEFLANHPRYRALRLLGRGGMGTVYLAKHLALDREVALKVIRPELLTRSDVVERFRREAKAAARLNHPNIVAVFDAETVDHQHFLVMEYIAGADLSRVVRERGQLPIEVACDYIRQAAQGLQHAHDQGMVHRDITPRNLMLTGTEQIKVLDFGLAEFVRDAAPSEAADRRMLVGSVDFMAPEQAADPQSADIRADIYSLGCTLWFLLTGQPPFAGGSLTDRLRRHAEEATPRIDQLRPEIPAELADVVDRMLHKNPAERFSTPAELATALSACARPEVPEHGETPTQLRRFPRPNLGILATAGILLAAFLAWAVFSRFASPDGASPTAAEYSVQSPEARRLYREGLHLLSERKEQQVHAAIARLERAVELAPQFARGQTALADAYNLCGDYGWNFADDVFPKAEAAARRALAQDAKLADAHLALAFALHAYDCEWQKAEAEYRRALELNPQLAAAHHWYAWFLAERGRPREAAEQIDRARQLTPDDLIVVNNVGKLMYLAHDFAGAARQHQYALELDPDFRKAHRDLGLAYAELGKLDEALAELEKSRGLSDDGRDVLAAEAYALARNGRADKARSLLPDLEAAAKLKPLDYELAIIYAALGEPDRAFQTLGRSVESHSAARAGMGIDPRFDSLHDDPRWPELIARVATPVKG
ncbi:MAG TPA: protein kinase [Pirellulales bacterium]|jgi:serine/threonine protein kinase/Tfp pilus assembly protein PilF|nr:protein kinase [Pirellulales bacterium]